MEQGCIFLLLLILYCGRKHSKKICICPGHGHVLSTLFGKSYLESRSGISPGFINSLSFFIFHSKLWKPLFLKESFFLNNMHLDTHEPTLA